MSSRWQIMEQVKRRLSGGKGKEASWQDPRELQKAIEQVLNGLLKVDMFKTTLAQGETIPEGLALATYLNIAVATYMNVSRAKLPAMPVRLPRNMGVWAVGPMVMNSTANILTAQFIPVPMGMNFMLQAQPMISGLLGQIGYEPNGLDITFTTDITAPPNNITAVWMKLVILDISLYSDYDLLPIPADMEAQVVDQVVAMYTPEQAPDKVDDPIALTEKTPGK